MAGNLTDFAENALLGHITGQTAYTKPTNTFAGLFTVLPADAGTGGTEVSAAGGSLYARQQITWAAAASGAISNSAAIRFPSAGNAGASWGTVVGIGIWDSLTVGNMLWYGSLSASVTVNSGDFFQIAIAGFTLALD